MCIISTSALAVFEFFFKNAAIGVQNCLQDAQRVNRRVFRFLARPQLDTYVDRKVDKESDAMFVLCVKENLTRIACTLRISLQKAQNIFALVRHVVCSIAAKLVQKMQDGILVPTVSLNG